MYYPYSEKYHPRPPFLRPVLRLSTRARISIDVSARIEGQFNIMGSGNGFLCIILTPDTPPSEENPMTAQAYKPSSGVYHVNENENWVLSVESFRNLWLLWGCVSALQTRIW